MATNGHDPLLFIDPAHPVGCCVCQSDTGANGTPQPRAARFGHGWPDDNHSHLFIQRATAFFNEHVKLH
jgi:hypothetical protein